MSRSPTTAKPRRISQAELTRLIAEHNRHAGTNFFPTRLGLEELTLWDGSELIRDGCAWFYRAAAPALNPFRANQEAPR